MSTFQPVRGTRDLLPEAYRGHRHVIETARRVAETYGFHEIATPIFEFTEIFARSMGEASDVVSKEMYSFNDKAGDKITLRPEYTAGICRAVISNGLTQSLPFKAFAAGPMFRYERPQKGRQRQFHQIDVELIGAAEPEADAEVIALAFDILAAIGVAGKCRLEMNTLGDAESRVAYRRILIDYLQAFRSDLSDDSRRRLETNPLRILDSKDPADRGIVNGAPLLTDYLTAAAADFFEAVQERLARLDIPFEINSRLVRGLDYYTHTAFEFVTEALGAQGAVIAGGRYDGLIAELGGPPTPAIGWAGGIERLALLMDEPPPLPRPIVLVPVGEKAEAMALGLARKLRQAGLVVEWAYRGNTGKRMKRAAKLDAAYAVLIGDDEIGRATATVRDLDSGVQEEIPLDRLVARLNARD